MKEIEVKTASFTGRIYIGEGIAKTMLSPLLNGSKNFVLTDSNVYRLYPDYFKGFKNAELFVLPAGEEHKNFQSLYQILQKMTCFGLHRNSTLFAVGGGVVGDIGGLCASLYMRGINCVQIPTTLLAQVDSSVGGKTAVDLDGVKNVVGAFYQPSIVLIDPEFLSTLPQREIKCGLGEIIKYTALNGNILERIEKNVDRLNEIDFLSGLIPECVRHKANVVETDEKEVGLRKSLNVGHTTGHAIELAYGLSHGESVLYGMKLETKLAIVEGVCDTAYGNRLLKLIDKALAISPKTSPDFSNLAQCLTKAKADKKNSSDGKIQMSVAKAENEWTLFALPFEEYQAKIVHLANFV